VPKSIDKLDFSILGYSGLKQYGGIIDEEWSKRLRGTYGPKVYQEMADASSAVGAINFAIESLVRQVEWRVEPAEPTQEGNDWAQFVEECLIDLDGTFDDFLSEVLSFLTYGWAYFETLYKLRKGLTGKKETNSRFDDGRIGWRGFALRAQDSIDHWQIAEDGTIEGFHQWDIVTGKRAFIPMVKALLFRTRTHKNNPEGRSIYRNAVNDYFYYKRICEIEAIGIERDMTGMIVMEVPIKLLRADAPAADKALLADLQKMCGELKRDEREYAIVPSKLNPDGSPTGYDLKLLSSGGRRQIDTDVIKRSYKVNILQSVLAQFLELGMASTGSFALASTQTDLFAVALGSFLDTIAATFNRDAIGKLMQYNQVQAELWPELVHGDLESPALVELGAYIQALAGVGQLPNDPAIQRKLLEIAKLPMPTKPEDEVSKKRRTKLKLQKASSC
jgi:hypothetical protein